MSLRSPRERFIQTLAFETGGLLMIVPLYMLVTGSAASEGFLLMITLSAAVMIWSPLHNAVFDWADLRATGRLASDRSHRWRVVHAISHEVTVVAVTLPILIFLGGFALEQALAANIGMTAVYTVYAYVFHLVYDRLRPVGRLEAGLIIS
ncbi:chlorhexidine efflux transporter [Tabrizicola sp.]|uniref:chlorhexidine efflux transporter n=1 Tax=Tabrizicola sp. TaxID=2005166 RepID=UPI003F40A139